MRVIITGGSGLIGSSLAAVLVEAGHEVVVLSRSPEKQRSHLPGGVGVAGWDGKTAEGWGRLADGAGAIVNLAGENLSSGRWTSARKKRMLESRVNAGQAVTQAVQAAAHKPGVVIQSSASGYYGPHGDEILTEESPPGEDYLARLCQAWEGSTATVETMGVRRVVTRSGVVLSTRGGALPLMVLPFRLFVGGPVGNGKQWLPWIHLQDEVSVLRFLIENEAAHGPINVAAPQQLTNAQFSQVIGRTLRRPAFVPAPAFAIKLVFGEMSTVVLDGQRLSSKKLEKLGYKFRFPGADQALEDILT